MYLFHEQYVTDAGAEIVDATITDKRFNISDPEDMDNLHAILCVSINHNNEPNAILVLLEKPHFLLLDCLYELQNGQHQFHCLYKKKCVHHQTFYYFRTN